MLDVGTCTQQQLKTALVTLLTRQNYGCQAILQGKAAIRCIQHRVKFAHLSNQMRNRTRYLIRSKY